VPLFFCPKLFVTLTRNARLIPKKGYAMRYLTALFLSLTLISGVLLIPNSGKALAEYKRQGTPSKQVLVGQGGQLIVNNDSHFLSFSTITSKLKSLANKIRHKSVKKTK
jgi:hypothetical protein